MFVKFVKNVIKQTMLLSEKNIFFAQKKALKAGNVIKLRKYKLRKKIKTASKTRHIRFFDTYIGLGYNGLLIKKIMLPTIKKVESIFMIY